MNQYWLLTGLGIIFFINALWLIFAGNFADRRTQGSGYKTYEFERNPVAFSCAVGLLLVLASACIQMSNPHIFAVAAKKIPQLNYLYAVGKMKNGLYYLLGGGFVGASILAFLFRSLVTGASTFTKGDDLDLNASAKRAHRAKVWSETPDWQRDGERKASQFDDGTPL